MRMHLRDRGTLLWVDSNEAPVYASWQQSGTTYAHSLGAPSVIRTALENASLDALTRSMRQRGYEGLVLFDSVATRSRYGKLLRALGPLTVVPQLRGLLLAPGYRVYLADKLTFELDEKHRDALWVVAAAMLQGMTPPQPASFPAMLREARSVEVAIKLWYRDRLQIWRSSRGGSIADALLKASTELTKRWQEKAVLLEGGKEQAINAVALQVLLLVHDGWIAEQHFDGLNHLISSQHGIGYERGGSWRYVLPSRVMHPPKGTPAQSLKTLMQAQGLSFDDRFRSDMRVYRFIEKPLTQRRAVREFDFSFTNRRSQAKP